MLDYEKLITKSGFCDALVKDVREALFADVGKWPLNRLKRQRAKVEKVLRRIEGKP